MTEREAPKAPTLLEIENTLRECQHEIRDLRRSNEIKAAQLDIVETFRVALLGPRRSTGMSPDVVWAADRLLERMINLKLAE